MPSIRRFLRPLVFALPVLAGLSIADALAASLFLPDATAITSKAAPADPKVIRQRLVTVNAAILGEQILPPAMDFSADRVSRSNSLEGSVTIDLFQGRSVVLRRQAVEESLEGGIVWTGDTGTNGYGILVVNGSHITGAFEVGGRHYLIAPVNGGPRHLLREVNTEAYPRDRHIDAPVGPSRHGSTAPSPTIAAATGNTTVTLLAVYTSRAKAILGAPWDKISLDVAIVNQGMINSNIPLRVKLVKIAAVSSPYNERAPADPVKPLYDLTSGSNANFPLLRNLRNTVQADLVTMYFDRPEYCGIAWILYPSLSSAYGFSAINANCQGTGTLAHELGHNMGLYHDRYVEPAASDSKYNYGYVNLAGKFRTIMSYSNKCSAYGVNCTSITYYSTPLKSYNGRPVGVAAGSAGAADAARLLRANRAAVAAFR
jgi:peptidyl-Asp metalloendopeptidase